MDGWPVTVTPLVLTMANLGYSFSINDLASACSFLCILTFGFASVSHVLTFSEQTLREEN